jgi:hypothetical protein
LGQQVRGWGLLEEQEGLGEGLSEGDRRYAINWCGGWSEAIFEEARAVGLALVSVDMVPRAQHGQEVIMDMELISPRWMRYELARQLGVGMEQLWVDWAGVPCTTFSSSDASNRRWCKKQKCRVWRNYRVPTGGSKGEPWHGLGHEKGELARKDARLAEAVVWMLTEQSCRWAIENPWAMLRAMEIMEGVQDLHYRVDYCAYWSGQERAEGWEHMKPTSIWTRRVQPGRWLGAMECCDECSCGYWKVGRTGQKYWVHRGQVQKLKKMAARLGISEEEAKCRYPRKMLGSWFDWVLGGTEGS